MKIILNGEPKDVPAQLSLAEMLDTHGYGGMTVAVAINQTFVGRNERTTTTLNDGDDVEVVAPMQGG